MRMVIGAGVLVTTLTGLCVESQARDCPEAQDSYIQSVRKVIDGQTYRDEITLFLDPNAPGNTAGHDWGSATRHYGPTPGQPDCETAKENCVLEDYSYAEVNISTTWAVTKMVTINGVSQQVQYTQADAIDFWNWYYAGFTPVGQDLLYTENCHGFAFGVGDWPHDGLYGVGVLLNDPDCYKAAVSISTVEIGVVSGETHSMKLTGEECGNPGYTPFQVISKQREKTRESPVYFKERPCPYGLDITGSPHNAAVLLYQKTN